MSLSTQYGTNVKKETEGVWFAFSANPDKTIPRVKLSHMGKNNKEYTKMLERATRPYRRQIELKTIDPEVAETVFKRVFISCIIREWENIQLEVLDESGKSKMDGDGNPEMEKIEVLNEENANRVFERLPYWYEELQGLASDVAAFREDEMEAEAKN